MGKRLVKTAKQQFEERLSELMLIKEFQLTESDVYFLCENKHHEMSILRKIHDNEFYEYKYDKSYSKLVESEEFLKEMTTRFNEADIPVKPLFEWYASADKDNEPFTLDDISMCNLEVEGHSVAFQDLYEEVSEIKIVTALEQWEKDSVNAKVAQHTDGDTYKVEVTDKAIVFYTYRSGCYSKEIYPSFSELRKDGEFVTNYIPFVRDSHPDDMEAALEWLAGREYTMSEVSLLDIYDVARSKEVIDYEEKKVSEVAKQDFKKELDALRKKMIDHIIQLCEQGMALNLEVFCQNHSIGWEDGHYQRLEDITDFFLMKNPDTGEWNYYMKEHKTSYNGVLSILNTETLYYIIESIQ